MRPQDNPFYVGDFNGHPSFWMSADDRLRQVKEFTAEQCRAALQVRGLQKTVESAIKRRLNKLEKAQ